MPDSVGRPLVLLLATQAILFVGVGACLPALPLYGAALGLPASATGVVISTPAVALGVLVHTQSRNDWVLKRDDNFVTAPTEQDRVSFIG